MGSSFRKKLVFVENVQKQASPGVPDAFNQPSVVVVPGGEQLVCKDRISGTVVL